MYHEMDEVILYTGKRVRLIKEMSGGRFMVAGEPSDHTHSEFYILYAEAIVSLANSEQQGGLA